MSCITQLLTGDWQSKEEEPGPPKKLGSSLSPKDMVRPGFTFYWTERLGTSEPPMTSI